MKNAQSCSARAGGLFDKSDPEMTRKSSEITQRGQRKAERGVANPGFGAMRVYKYTDQFWLYHSYRQWRLADRSRRERHTYTRVWLARRLNIPDAYHDNNSVATVALFDWPRLISAGEIWVRVRIIYHVNISALFAN